MADFLNLYKIKNVKTGVISDFVDNQGLEDFFSYLKAENKSIEDYAIYSLKMQNIAPYLDMEKLQWEQ